MAFHPAQSSSSYSLYQPPSTNVNENENENENSDVIYTNDEPYKYSDDGNVSEIEIDNTNAIPPSEINIDNTNVNPPSEIAIDSTIIDPPIAITPAQRREAFQSKLRLKWLSNSNCHAIIVYLYSIRI